MASKLTTICFTPRVLDSRSRSRSRPADDPVNGLAGWNSELQMFSAETSNQLQLLRCQNAHRLAVTSSRRERISKACFLTFLLVVE